MKLFITLFAFFMLQISSPSSAQTISVNVYPNQNTVMIPGDFNSSAKIRLPHGDYKVIASFNNTHAGGDIDKVFMWASNGEITPAFPRGHAIHLSLGTTPQYFSLPLPSNFPDSVEINLFFLDGGDLNDNSGTANLLFIKQPGLSSNDSFRVSVRPDENTLLIPSNFSLSKKVRLPHGKYKVHAQLLNTHAGGDITRVLFWAPSGESTTYYPRGHAIHESFGADTIMVDFPLPSTLDSIDGYLFFVDGGNLNDNTGTATVNFTKITSQFTDTLTVQVKPNQNTMLIPANFANPKKVRLPHGTFNVSASFFNAHAGGDIDKVFFWTTTGEMTTQFPNGHAIHLAIPSTPITISLPTPSTLLDTVDCYLFFVDGGDLNDNRGTAEVTFRRMNGTQIIDSVSIIVDPKINTALFPTNFGAAATVNLTHGEWFVTSSFDNTHAGGTIDKVLLWTYSGETTPLFPVGHAINESIGTDTTKIILPTPSGMANNIPVSLFFLDGGDLGDNTGTATVKFYRIKTAVKEVFQPSGFYLAQNYPNPFNPSTVIDYQLPFAGNVSLRVYDILGKQITTLVDGYRDAGHHSVSFSGGGLANGVYIYRMQTGSFVQSRKLILVK